MKRRETGLRMKRVGRVSTVMCVSVVMLMFVACNRDRDVILQELKKLELSGDYEERDLNRKTEKELLQGIRFLEDEVNRTVDAGVHLGTYYKLVAIEYRDRDMFGLAKEFFEKAIGVEPKNPFLAYWDAVCTAQLAEARQNAGEHKVLVDEARDGYLRAIDLDPKYSDALYGLSVLLIFEYDQPAAAEPYLDRILAVESRNFRAMFLLARVYVISGRIDDAISLYDKIASESGDETMKNQAKANRDELRGGTRAR